MTIVHDVTAPVISGASVDKPVLGPPNHKMIGVALSYAVTDDVDASPACSVSVSSNEPLNGTGDGDTAPDWRVVSPRHVQLRAERAGTGAGRIYTLTLTCTDTAGNSSSRQSFVTVPTGR